MHKISTLLCEKAEDSFVSHLIQIVKDNVLPLNANLISQIHVVFAYHLKPFIRFIPGVSNGTVCWIKILMVLLTKFFVRVVLRDVVNQCRTNSHVVMVTLSCQPKFVGVLVRKLVVQT